MARAVWLWQTCPLGHWPGATIKQPGSILPIWGHSLLLMSFGASLGDLCPPSLLVGQQLCREQDLGLPVAGQHGWAQWLSPLDVVDLPHS